MKDIMKKCEIVFEFDKMTIDECIRYLNCLKQRFGNESILIKSVPKKQYFNIYFKSNEK